MSRPVSIVTFAAAFAACALAVGTIAYGIVSYHSFLNVEGLTIVVGGSIANAFLSYRRDDVLKAFSAISQLLRKNYAAHEGLQDDIMQLIRWSYIVQAQDFIGLEKESASQIDEPLMRYGMDLVVSGYHADHIREMMHTSAEAEFERRTAPVTVLRNMAATAPAFGMVGTLVGMVCILQNVGTDLTGIGGGLGIAMLSTLYGLLAARLICLPAADKLLLQEESEHFRNHMITEGLAMLAEKQRPFYMQDRLNSFLEPSRHITLDHEQLAFHRQFAMAA